MLGQLLAMMGSTPSSSAVTLTTPNCAPVVTGFMLTSTAKGVHPNQDDNGNCLCPREQVSCCGRSREP